MFGAWSAELTMRLDGFIRSFRAGGIDLSDSILFRGGGDGGGDLIWD